MIYHLSVYIYNVINLPQKLFDPMRNDVFHMHDKQIQPQANIADAGVE